MYQVLKTIAVCVVLLTSVAQSANDWRLKIDRVGIQVYQQNQGSEFRQWHTKGVMTVRADPETVLDLFNDLEVCEEWIHGCLSSKRTEQNLIHMVVKGPLWYKDRDVVFSADPSFDAKSGQWQINIASQPLEYADQDYVRIENMQAQWLITPVTDKKTMITYQLYIDPQISFKAAVNKFNRDAMFTSFQKMRKLLRLRTN